MLTSATFEAMGTTTTVAVKAARDLEVALAVVRSEIHAVDQACSRFKEDSELSRLNRRAGVETELSPLLEEAILASLRCAQMTGGLVDPTVGRQMEMVGYTVTFRDLPQDGPPLQLRYQPARGWSSLFYDPDRHTLRIPGDVSLDLGASGKAWAADRAAAAVLESLGVSVAVECGGDLAVAGPPPADGWPVRVETAEHGGVFEDVAVFHGGLATSGVSARRWRRGDDDLHHIIDPATGLPARTDWRMVTVAAATCLEANAAATAALIMGAGATSWLDRLQLPARLVDAQGAVRYAGGWGA